jgi:hypothetical protein
MVEVKLVLPRFLKTKCTGNERSKKDYMAPLKNYLETLNKIANKTMENTYTELDFSWLDQHGILENLVSYTETTLLSVSRELKQRKRTTSIETILKSCGTEVADRNQYIMIVADQEEADEQDTTDDVVEALEDIGDSYLGPDGDSIDSPDIIE